MQYYFREKSAFSFVSTVLFFSFQKAAQRHGPKRNVFPSSVWKAIVGSAQSADLDPSISSGMNPNAVCMTMKRSWIWSLQLRGLKAVQQHISTAGFRITRPAPHAGVMFPCQLSGRVQRLCCCAVASDNTWISSESGSVWKWASFNSATFHNRHKAETNMSREASEVLSLSPLKPLYILPDRPIIC